MILFESKYKGKFNGAPSDKSEKNKEWHLNWAKSIYSRYMSGTCASSFGATRFGTSVAELRNYARGLQDPKKYMEILDKKGDDGKHFLNISWRTVSILPQFRGNLKSSLNAVEFGMGTVAIDDESSNHKDLLVNKLKVKTNPEMQMLAQEIGADMGDMMGAESPMDVDLLNNMGGIRLQVEIAMKDAIDAFSEHSDIEVIRSQIEDDIIDLNMAALEPIIDSSGEFRCKYIDPAKYISGFSKYKDHRDVDFQGYLEEKTIREIREETGMDDRDFKKIVNSYKSEYRRIRRDGERDDYMNEDTENIFDRESVTVMQFYVIACEENTYIKGKDRGGHRIFDKVSNDAKLSKKDIKRGKEIVKNKIHNVYKGKWVVGTDFIYDYGVHDNVMRSGKKGSKRAILPIVFYKNDEPSYVDRCIGLVDDIQLAIFKTRQMLAKLPPAPRIFIDQSLLERSVRIGKNEYNTREMLEAFYKTGAFIGRSKSEFDGFEGGSNRSPIDKIPIDVHNDFNMLQSEIATKLDQLNRVTGSNDIAMGTGGSPEMLKGVMEGFNRAANKAIMPYLEISKNIHVNMYRRVVKLWQLKAREGDFMLPFISGETVKVLKLTKNIAFAEFGITVEILPGEDERNMMIQMMHTDRQTGKIGDEDFFLLLNMIKQGDFKKAQFFYARSAKKQADLIHQREMEKIQGQGDANAKAGMMSEEARQKTIQLQGSIDTDLQVAKYEMEDKNAKNRAEEKMKELVYTLNNQKETSNNE